MPTATLARPLTAEEIRIRGFIQQCRSNLLILVHKRRLIKELYRMPHGSPEYLLKRAELARHFGDSFNRDAFRLDITLWHCAMADLKGKHHLRPQKA